MKRIFFAIAILGSLAAFSAHTEEEKVYLYLKGAASNIEASIDLNNISGTETDLRMQLTISNQNDSDLAISARDTLVVYTSKDNKSIARVALPAVIPAKSSITNGIVVHAENAVGFVTGLAMIAEIAKKHKGDPGLSKFDPGIGATLYFDSIAQTIKLALTFEYSTKMPLIGSSTATYPKDELAEIEEAISPFTGAYSSMIAKWSDKSGQMDKSTGIHWDKVSIDSGSLTVSETTGSKWTYHFRSNDFIELYTRLRDNASFAGLIANSRVYGKMRSNSFSEMDVLLLSIVTPKGTRVMFESEDKDLAARFK